MATAKMTLLEIVQDVLNDLDSDEVNSISDTVEATQIANVCRSVYYDVITTVDLPEHTELMRVTGLSDSTRPNFMDANNITEIKELRYNVSETAGQIEYSLVNYLLPDEFIQRIVKRDTSSSEIILVTDPTSGISLPIDNSRMPTYYTSFDDRYLFISSIIIFIHILLALMILQLVTLLILLYILF